MEPSDDNVQMLLAMGFPSESEVRRALKMAKNDMNEAVDILTNGQALSPFEDLPSPGANQQQEGGGVSLSQSQCHLMCVMEQYGVVSSNNQFTQYTNT